MEHTKGEWKMRNECKQTYFIELGNNEGIITIFTDVPERTEEIAHLIVAAPGLLFALHAIAKTEGAMVDNLRAVALAAIAKVS